MSDAKNPKTEVAEELTTLRTFKDVQKLTTELGCGSETHLLTKEVDGKVEPTGEKFWRISSHNPKVLIGLIETLSASHFKVAAPDTSPVKDQPIGRVPNGAFYIELPFTYDKETPRGERPRIVLGREG